jgi:large subunit ribosomal protein L23
MSEPWKVLKEYRVTEKSNILSSTANQYTFELWEGANRLEVAAAVEQIFKVRVLKVNVVNRHAKVKRSRMRRCRPGSRRAVKKAIVTLDKGQKIELI